MPTVAIGTAIQHLVVPDRVKPSFVICDIQALWRSALSVRVPRCQNYKWRLNPVWHRMGPTCSGTYMATLASQGKQSKPAGHTAANGPGLTNMIWWITEFWSHWRGGGTQLRTSHSCVPNVWSSGGQCIRPPTKNASVNQT